MPAGVYECALSTIRNFYWYKIRKKNLQKDLAFYAIFNYTGKAPGMFICGLLDDTPFCDLN